MAEDEKAQPDWNLARVKAKQAWALIANDSQDPQQIDWQDVAVGHLDTGYVEHPIFGDWSEGQSWLRPHDGKNFVEPDDLPYDHLNNDSSLLHPGHGIRTQSVLCGDARRLQQPFFIGLAPGLPVVPYRVTETVFLAKEEIRAHIRDAIDAAIAKKLGVLSISLGWPWSHTPMDDGMDRAYEAGLIVVAAGGQGVDRVTFPARYWRAIGVGGTRFSGRYYQRYTRPDERNYIDVWAPADHIYRAHFFLDATIEAVRYDIDNSQNDPLTDYSQARASSGFSFWNFGSAGTISGGGDGTSYATVHVAAAAAMWLRHRSAEIEALYGDTPWCIVEAFRLLLQRTAQPVNGRTRDDGKGELHIPNLLKSPLPAVHELQQKPPASGQFA